MATKESTMRKYIRKAIGLVKKILGLNKQFMLDFDHLYKKWDMKITGVLVIGAHYFREQEQYTSKGIKNFILIEPGRQARALLFERFASKDGYEVYWCACGSERKQMTMYTETANDGQSNSLLQPDQHLRLHEEIKFNDTEQVMVYPLDELSKDFKHPYNFLSLDVQGYELEVLKGAVKTLGRIDYIMAEVNQVGASVYKGATNIKEMDLFLLQHGFLRVLEPTWVKNSYGDALWVRSSLFDLKSGKPYYTNMPRL